jgi:hypothetical protein
LSVWVLTVTMVPSLQHTRGKSLLYVFFRLFLCESRDEHDSGKNISRDSS